MASTAPPAPASWRARSIAASGSATISASGPASCWASDSSVAGGSARGFAQRVKTSVVGERQQRHEHVGGVLVLEDADDEHQRPAVADHLGQGVGERGRPSGVVGAVVERQRALGDDLEAAGDPRLGGRRDDRRAVERALQERLGGGLGEREVAPLERAAGEQVAGHAGRLGVGSDHEPRVALGGDPLGDGERVGVEVGRDDERGVVADDGELLGGDVGDRRAEPARVLEPDAGQHLDLRRDHVGRVIAAAEARLDHRDLDLAGRELVEGGRGDRLELGHAVVGVPGGGVDPGGALDQRGGLGRALDRGGEAARPRSAPPRPRSARGSGAGGARCSCRCAGRGARGSRR